MTSKVVIIGAGEIGQAIGKILGDKGIIAVFWDRDPAKTTLGVSLEELIPQAEFIFLCIPSWAMRAVINQIRPLLRENTILVSLAKGIEAETKRTMDELLKEILPQGQPFALLSGSMIAEELNQGKLRLGVVATEKKESYEKILDLFRGTKLRVEYSDDPRSTALAAVLKNIYAIAIGITEALDWNGNARAWFTAKATREMAEVIGALHGKKEIALDTAGLGDLLGTGYSPYSKNRRTGNELVKNGGWPGGWPTEAAKKSEGINSLPLILELLSSRKSDFPILRALDDILSRHKDARQIFEELISQK